MKVSTSKLLFTTICCLFFGVVNAQKPFFKLHNVNSDQNSSLKINCLYQSQEGYLWLGTKSGLVRFDGVDSKNFTNELNTESSEVLSIASDTSNVIWVGYSSGGIFKFQNNVFERFDSDAAPTGVKITDILFDKQKRLWFSTYGEGIYYYHDNRLYNISEEDGLADNYIYSLEKGKGNNVLAGSDAGLAVCSVDENDEKSVKMLSAQEGLPDEIVKVIVKSKEKDGYWIGLQEKGVCFYYNDTEKFEVDNVFSNWSFGEVSGIVDLKTELWISTKRNGLFSYHIKDNRLKRYTTTNGLASNRVEALWDGNQGNVWIGTNQGLIQSPANRFEYLTTEVTRDGKNIQAISYSNDEKVWYSNENGLHSLEIGEDNNPIITQHLTYSSKNLNIICLYEDIYGYLWIGSYGKGLYRYNPKTKALNKYDKSKGLTSGDVLSITGKDNTIWVSTLGGVTKVDIRREGGGANQVIELEGFTANDGLASDFIYYSFIDSEGNVWFATDGGGVTLMKGKEFTQYNQENGLSAKTIYSITEDKFGNKWFSTPDEGVFKFDGKNFTRFGVDEGLSSAAIKSLFSDKNGNVIIINNLGIDVLDPETNFIRGYGDEVGIIDMEPFLNTFSKGKSGDVWIGTSNGIIKYHPLDPSYQQMPEVQISDIQILLSPLLNKGKRSFSYDENHFTFYYQAVWLQDPAKVRYRYKLENYDIEWILTQNNFNTYSSLPPGEYTFSVNTSVGNSFSENSRVSYKFQINPPFWQTTWFTFSAVFVIVVGIYGFVKVRESRLLQAKKALEDEVKKRTSEILQQKEEIQAQRDQIAANSERLKVAYDEIETQNTKIKSSINYAQRIQVAMLPSENLIREILPEHFILYLPRDIVSGDFYWTYKYNKRLYVAAADCTGHGVPGAFMSLIGTAFLNEILAHSGSDNEAIKPAQILTQLNTLVQTSLEQDQEQERSGSSSRDGMDISLCCFDLEKEVIEYSGAKRPFYYFKDGELQVIKGDKLAIGGGANQMKKGNEFTNQEIPIKEVEMIYMFTDGYVDQFGGENDQKFMVGKFKKLIHDIYKLPMADQQVKLHLEFMEWKGDTMQTDDVLVFGLNPRHLLMS